MEQGVLYYRADTVNSRTSIGLPSTPAVLLGVWLAILGFRAEADQTIYDDTLQNSWENWSWATVNFNNSSPVHAGTKSISVTAGAWQALYFHHSAFDPSAYTNLNLWIHGGTSGGQRLLVKAMLGSTVFDPGRAIGPLAANTWQQLNIPIS